MDDMSAESIADTLDSGTDGLSIADDVANEDSQGSEDVSDVTTPDDGDKDANDKGNDGVDAIKAEYEEKLRSLQSLHDKHYADQKAENAKLSGQVEALMSQQNQVSNAQLEALNQKEQEAFDKEWENRIEENPAESIKFYRQMAREQMELQQAQFQRMLENELGKLNINERLQQLQPGFKESQEKAQALAQELDIPFDAAMKVVQKESQSKSVRQPDAPKAPGRVSGGKTPNGDTPVAPVELGALNEHMMEMTGVLDAKDMAKIAKEVAKDMAS